MAGVKKATGTRVRRKAVAEVPPKPMVPLKPEGCSRFVRRRVAEELPVICESLLDKAKQGDATALKTLWQMAGLSQAGTRAGADAKGSRSPGDADRRGEAFARAALKKFGGI